MQLKTSSRLRSLARDRDESASLTFAIAELGSRSRRVDGLDHRDRGAWLAIAKVFRFVHRGRNHKWFAIAKSKFAQVNNDLFPKHELSPFFSPFPTF